MTGLRYSCAILVIAASPIAAALAHGEGLQSGTRWICALDKPLYDHEGSLAVTLLDEAGIDAPNVALTFDDGTRLTHILSSNWPDGMVFIQDSDEASELTLIRNTFIPTDFALTIYQPATKTQHTVATCKET